MRKIGRPGQRFVAKVHPVRMQQAGDPTAKSEKPIDVRGFLNDVNIQIPPGHQPQRIAANEMHLAIFCEERAQAGVQDAIRLGLDVIGRGQIDHLG